MSEYICYYKGELLDPAVSKIEQLKSKGLTESQVEAIEHEAYTCPCCESFDKLECARPIIDYGVPSLRGYQAAVPRLDKDNRIYYTWVVWDYCPFCGKPLAKEIRPEHRQLRMEDFC